MPNYVFSKVGLVSLIMLFSFLTIPTFGEASVGADPRIVSGTAVWDGDNRYPWYARIAFLDDDDNEKGAFCGGMLVSPEFVLTAAHCFVDDDGNPDVDRFRFRVQIGLLCDNDAVENEQGENCGQKLEETDAFTELEGVVLHNYNPVTRDLDFALIKLHRRSEIAPVAMDLDGIVDNDNYVNQTLWAIGFGDTSQGGNPPDPFVLQEVEITFDSDCDGYSPELITENMICAGAFDDGDSCQGDSGGPLYDMENEVLVGVTSFGNGCNKNKIGGVYAKVSAAADFIRNTVCPNSNVRPDFCLVCGFERRQDENFVLDPDFDPDGDELAPFPAGTEEDPLFIDAADVEAGLVDVQLTVNAENNLPIQVTVRSSEFDLGREMSRVLERFNVGDERPSPIVLLAPFTCTEDDDCIGEEDANGRFYFITVTTTNAAGTTILGEKTCHVIIVPADDTNPSSSSSSSKSASKTKSGSTGGPSAEKQSRAKSAKSPKSPKSRKSGSSPRSSSSASSPRSSSSASSPKSSPNSPKSSPDSPKSSPGSTKSSPDSPKSSPDSPKSNPSAPKTSSSKNSKSSPDSPKSSPSAPKSSPSSPSNNNSSSSGDEEENLREELMDSVTRIRTGETVTIAAA